MSESNFSIKALRCYLAEYVATFVLVLVGTGAIVINDVAGGITHVGIALCFGFVVAIMIYTFGNISGAHMNPAVSIGFFVVRELGFVRLVFYLVAQIAGALTASGLLRMVFFQHGTLGATLPNMEITGADPVVASVVLEFLTTFILMLVILAVTMKTQSAGNMVGVVVGIVIGMEAMFAGPICGASMNPARSLGPAVVGVNYQFLWIYLAAPVAGALFASLLSPLLLGNRHEGNEQY